MTLTTLKDSLPDYAKDLKLNVGAIDTIESLDKKQVYGIALASAYATRHPQVVRAARESAAMHVDDATARAAKIAASVMAMNNVYYRFAHLVSDPEYAKMPARLRMSAIANPGIEKRDFELFALAVSAINGCGMCMDSHEKVLVQAGLTRTQVQDAIRVAAIISALAGTLAIEEAG
ncbi:MAG: carboxymuconolactone decarboxylase family protein [Planctomycetes bacterium]|nr:carboxymuconolactone decarboxylase family protein [Planctomycetota bacterium]MCC7172647.1 carboxymuconolactone decarboxylase family protein [Planctomycetota bacterium]